MSKFLVLCALVHLAVSQNGEDQCYNCNGGSHACLSDTQRVPCFDNVPQIEDIENCPEGLFCSDGQCTETPVEARQCLICDRCIAGQTFTCLDRTTFKSCSTGDTGECGVGTECFPSLISPCYAPDPSLGGQCLKSIVPETTPAPLQTTTVPSTTTTTPYEVTFCGRKRIRGSFASNRVLDCTEYIECSLLRDGRWTGEYKRCPSGTLFDPAYGKCKSSKHFVCRPPF